MLTLEMARHIELAGLFERLCKRLGIEFFRHGYESYEYSYSVIGTNLKVFVNSKHNFECYPTKFYRTPKEDLTMECCWNKGKGFDDGDSLGKYLLKEIEKCK